jgi:hypothetical protein
LATNAGQFHAALAQRIVLGCRPEEPGLYLLGSHVEGSTVATSDVDLAVVFGRPIDSAIRKKISDVLSAIQRETPILLDGIVLDSDETTRGLTPNLIRARLLGGPDLLAMRPLRPQPELMLYYVGLVMGFMQLSHSRSIAGQLSLPIRAPDPGDRYLGYTQIGIRIGNGQYRPGVSLLVKLVLAIASFRLALLKGIFVMNKQEAAARYREALPDDPWQPLIQHVYELGRVQLAGELPMNPEHQTQLESCCGQVAALENDFVGSVLINLPVWLPFADKAFRSQAADMLGRIQGSSAAYQEQLEAIKAALKPKNS